jgi:excinuclease ABC subunit C
MKQIEFANIAHTIPMHPGIYKYFDEANTLLYVGKAKSLRKRVSSYFSKTVTNNKTYELVQRIHHIEFTIVNNEHDAFLLESNLIKEYQPKYNIALKDGKSYPYIVIKNEPFPRIFFTRRVINDGSTYFGPYTSVHNVRELLEFIKQNIPLRNCNLNLTANNIAQKKFKVCLEYHLGNCKGPCDSFQTVAEYDEGIQHIKNILKGNVSQVIQQFKKTMQEYASAMDFEKAARLLNKIEHLQEYQAKSTIVSARLGTLDVFSILEENETAYINYLAVNNGSIVQTKTILLEKKLEETAAEVMPFAIAYLRKQFNSEAKEIIVPFLIAYADPSISIIIPRSGDKKKLLELSLKNVNYFKDELRKKKILYLEEKTEHEKMQVLHQLQKDLQLPALPLHIECFDNSNFQGSYPVSAMVCFKNGQPSKAEYRRYHVKTVKGINDFASMKEVVYRRYKRLIEEHQPIPQLVIIDGGKGQLSAAMESINLLRDFQSGSISANLAEARDLGSPLKDMVIVGLAKNEEELFFPGDTQSIKLSWNSESLKLIRRIRDEVHQHGIGFHRNLRSKGAFNNELEQVKGIGKGTINLLLKTFKSVAKIKMAEEEALTAVIGQSKTKLLKSYFSTTSESK